MYPSDYCLSGDTYVVNVVNDADPSLEMLTALESTRANTVRFITQNGQYLPLYWAGKINTNVKRVEVVTPVKISAKGRRRWMFVVSGFGETSFEVANE